MPLDPRRYNVNELRHAAHGRNPAEFDWVDAPVDKEWNDVAYQRLLAATAEVASDGRPYLDSIPHTPNAEQVLLDWCVHLVERLGGRGSLEMVSYYRDIGWVGDDAHDTIRERILSFTTPTDFEDAPTEEDHVQSLSYVVRLSSMDDE
ncbi:fla cluster protein flaD [Haloferax larsenii]|uniref:Fla cluster protein flaD n=1 Tax=Haloferax larsenii TaxID=302484 RepID=A0ABY5RBI7_HALLR|nr:FlaD/FlaE family flagellar protein [Haloferax larsenii]ELZ82820.1 fla cluster protein flaD [Haloferax larsenii JCM 13917]UVE49390.1 fla cluster protein flaD [Haloferax larsenii]